MFIILKIDINHKSFYSMWAIDQKILPIFIKGREKLHFQADIISDDACNKILNEPALNISTEKEHDMEINTIILNLKFDNLLQKTGYLEYFSSITNQKILDFIIDCRINMRDKLLTGLIEE